MNLGIRLYGDYYYTYLEFMGLFRDPDKFGALVSLSMAYLLSQSLDDLFTNIKTNKQQILTVTLVLIFLIINYPAMTGDYKGNHTTFPMPQSYFEVNDWIAQNTDEGLALWIPADVYMSFNWTNGKSIGDFSQFYSSIPTLNPVMDTSRELKPMVNHLINYVVREIDSNSTEHLGKFLGLHNVKYLVIRADTVIPYDGALLLKSDWKNSGFELVHSNPPLYVYENKLYQGNVRIINETFLVSGGINELRKLGYVLPEFTGYAFQLTDYSDETISDVDVFFSELDLMDSVIQSIPETDLIVPSEHVDSQGSSGWIASSVFKHQKHALKESIVAVTYSSDAELEIPFNLSAVDDYTIFMRAVGAYSSISLSIDDKELKIVNLPWKIAWDNVLTIPLSPGIHKLKIRSDKVLSEIIIDQIIITSKTTYDSTVLNIHEALQNKSYLLFKEAEDIIGPTSRLVINSNLSENKGIILNGGLQVTQESEFYCPQDGNYRLHVRGNSSISANIFTVFTSNTKVETINIPLEKTLQWHHSDPVYLKSGTYSLFMRSPQAQLDLIVFSKSNDTRYFQNHITQNLTILKNNPIQKIIKVSTNVTKIITTEAYNNWWKCKVNEIPTAIQPTELYSMIIELPATTSARIITLDYSLQYWGNIGWLITLLSVISSISAYFYLKKR